MTYKKNFLNEPRITTLNKRFAYCGQQLLENYNMMDEWD